MSDLKISVDQFLAIRELIAEKLKENSSTQKPTRIKQAEELLKAGYIDITGVLSVVEERLVPTYHAIEQ